MAEAAESVPPDTPLSEISDPVAHRLPYSNIALKPESATDDGQIPSEETDTLEGTSGSSQLAYPIYDTDIHTIRAVESETSGVWCAEYKPVGTIGTDHYGVLAYDMDQITSPGNYVDGSGYDMGSYELPFDISEQTMGGIPEYL